MTDRVQERVAAFGPGGGLIGVLTLPEGTGPTPVPHVILLNSGIIHRVGTNRLSVSLARALGAAGVPSLRFDFSGIGDSERRGDVGSLRESVERDIADAIAYLRTTLGTCRVVLMGVCSGAFDSFHAALSNEPVVGAVMIDMPGPFQTWRHTAYHLASRLFQPASWRNPWRKFERYSRMLVRSEAPKVDEEGYVIGGRSRGRREKMRERLDRLLTRGVRLYFAFTSGLQTNYNHRSLFRTTFPRAARHPGLSFDYFPEADHMLSSREARAEVIDRIVRWMLTQTFSELPVGGTRGVEERVVDAARAKPAGNGGSAAGSPVPSRTLKIEAVNPLHHQDELKKLFLAHGVTHYPEFLDRAYPAAVAAGAASWVAFDERRRIVMHMARLPQRFSFAGRAVTGGLLVNMMVDKEHRTFFPAATMARRAVADSKTHKGVDFLYTNPNEGGGAIVKSGGLKSAATLQRFVLPLRGDHWPEDIAIRLYGSARRFRTSGRSGMVEHEADGFSVEDFVAPGKTNCVTALHPREQYTRWLAGYPGPNDRWFTFDEGGHPGAGILVREEEGGTYRLLVVWRRAGVALGPMLWPLARILRRRGARRLQVWTLAESPFAAEIKALGFLPRADTQSFLVLPLTPAGAEVVQALPNWEITDFDCDR